MNRKEKDQNREKVSKRGQTRTSKIFTLRREQAAHCRRKMMAPKMAPPSTSKSTFRTCKRTKNQNRNTRRRKYAVAMNQNQKKDASFFPTSIQKKQLLTVQNRHFTERSKPTSKHTPHTQCPKHHKQPECSRKEKRAAQPTTQTCSGQPVRKEAR